MPTPQNKRIVVLQSSFNATPVSTLNLTMNAVFTTTATATNKFEDASADNSEDKTKYRMKFVNGAGAEIGVITLRLVAKGDPAAGVTLSKTGRSTIVPGPTVTDVTLIESPAASFERIWKQAVADGSGGQAVDDIAKLDMRVSAGTGFTVSQTVTTQANNQLVISYSWLSGSGAPAVTGTVTLDSAVTAAAGYTLGNIRITDNNPTTGEERRR